MTRSKVTVVGGTGRMGQRLLRLLEAHPTLMLGTVLVPAGRRQFAAGVPCVTSPEEALREAQVVIDFSAPPACATVAPHCAARKIPYVLASTGLGETEQAAVDAAAQKVPVLQAANLSVGVQVMREIVEQAARRLKDFDVEISEIHHRHKRDAPSGTAYALGAAVQRGAGPRQAVLGRQGLEAPRQASELGYAALRGGDVAGEHTVYFFGDAERLEITHRSASGDIFAAGALRAAAWLLGRAPGHYTMADVLAPS